MSEVFRYVTISGIPADREWNDRIAAQLPVGVEPFRPTVEHSLANCAACGISVWIGPKQKQLHESVFVATKIICAICLFTSADNLDADYKIIPLNPDIDNAPLRY